MKKSILLLFAAALWFQVTGMAPARRDYYELRIYRITGKAQEEKMDSYLKEAFLPALHRDGIPKVGVFKPVETDTTFGKIIYVLIPFRSAAQWLDLPGVLAGDDAFQAAAKPYHDAPYNEPPFRRMENIFMKSFSQMPEFRAPSYTTPMKERIYELRSYESATEEKGRLKVHMFNEGGEIALFEKLGFNAAFYGEVLAGSKRPNLMYMTTFENLASREKHWTEFRNHPEWKTLSGLELYKNTVSKNNTMLLHPADYSDF